MAPADDRGEFIRRNLPLLVEHTVLNVELINCLFSEGLILKSEQEYLMNPLIISSSKVTHLYTDIASKWDDELYERFIELLRTTGNLRVHEKITEDLTKAQIAFLKEQMIKVQGHKAGAYEGINLEAEIAANTILGYFVDGSLFSEDNFLCNHSLEERQAIVTIIKKFISGIECSVVWFNKWKPKLPEHYIDRKVTESKQVLWREPVLCLIDLVLNTTDKLIFLVDGPGMGKSTALTKLELDLRDKIEIPQRIIIRINLNQFCGTLQQVATNQVSLEYFLSEFAGYVPAEVLKSKGSKVPLYILLDGLDEVLPEYKDVMLRILGGLLNSVSADETFNVSKIVLTTRPHLKELVEKEFGVKSQSLCPIEEHKRIDYLVRELKTCSRDDVVKNLKRLPREVLSLLSNPLILHMYSQVWGDNSSNNVTDLYSLYHNFVDRKHELYLFEKENADPALPASILRKNNFLKNVLTAYYFIASRQLPYWLGTNNLLLSFIEGRQILEESIGDRVEELLSYGLVVIEQKILQFKHRSFAEFFYARMMAETKDDQFRNALFSLGYEGKNLVAKFHHANFRGIKFVR